MAGEPFGLKRAPNGVGVFDSEKLHYDTIDEYLRITIFGLCGCGSNGVEDFAYDALRACDRKINGERPPAEALRLLVESKPELAAEFILHMLDHLGLTDHGSSVFGSWPSGLGREVMEYKETTDG